MLEYLKNKINDEYVNTEVSKIKDGDLDLVMDNQEEINKKISGAGRLKQFAELGKMMFGMLQDYKRGTYKGAPWFSIAAIAVILLYVFNPLDIIPDFVPGLGYIDDFLVFATTLKFLESDLHSYLDWKLGNGKS